MLTKNPSETASPEAPAATKPHAAAGAARVDELVCYFEGDYVPLKDARVNIMTHAFMYGTAVFEGIRGYWRAEHQTLFALRVRDHVERIRDNARMLLMEDLPSVDELTGLIVETVRRNHFREDIYVRPSFYKSTRAIGVRLHDLEHQLYIVTLPFGDYVDTSGCRLMTSSWRRNADEALPARGKIVGGYVNMAFQKSEAELKFVIRDGVTITPPVTDDILEGVTRKAIMEIAHDEGLPVEVRSIDRSEIYVADEMFLCGTGVQISPVLELDHRQVGSGQMGPITRRLRDRYFDAVRGRLPAYRHWLTPIPEGD